MSRPGIALQMYTVREDAQRDFSGTLRAVAAMGYPAVQLAGYGGLAADALRDLLGELDLAVAGSHIGLDRLIEATDEEIAFNLALGNRDLVCPAPPPNRRATVDDFRWLADQLNAVGRRCQAAGARLSYHNHAFEFTRFATESGGATTTSAFALDLLLAWTEPTLVYFEPDVYWIARAGEDPAAYLHRYTGRCPLVHLKDVANDAEGSFAEVGEGRLDFEPIFSAAETGGAEWYVVEQDRCSGPAMASARLSLENLRRWGKL